jgi:glucan biosynthesis protein C
LWYIPYIWTYSMILLPLCIYLRSSAGRGRLQRLLRCLENPWGLLLIVVPSALSDVVLRPFWPHDANNLFADWGNFVHKLTFFAAGFVLASGSATYDRIAANRVRFLVAGIVLFALESTLRRHLGHPSRLDWGVYRVLNNLQIWMWLLTALGFGRKYLNFNHPFLRYSTEAVYPFYILHQTVLIVLAYHLAYLNWSIGVKFIVVLSATFFIVWLIYASAIRPWNPMRVAFGLKWKRSRQGEPAARIDSRGWLPPGNATMAPPPVSSES